MELYVRAFPISLLRSAISSMDLLNELDGAWMALNHPTDYYKTSPVVAGKICSIPLPSTNDQEAFEAKHRSKGLQNFRPWYVSQHNCGSRPGMAQIMTDIFFAAKPLLEKRVYPYVRVDVSLFLSWFNVRHLILNVPHSSSVCIRNNPSSTPSGSWSVRFLNTFMRTSTWWKASGATRTFLQPFLGPYFHQIYPQSPVTFFLPVAYFF